MWQLITYDANHKSTKQEFNTLDEFHQGYWKAVGDNTVYLIETEQEKYHVRY